MTPYHVTFLPIFLAGCLVALVCSIFAGKARGCLIPGLLLCVGIVAFWAALFVGADSGYRAWQSMPDPPEEAFSDASVMGALLIGWVPGLMFCLVVFGIVRGLGLLFRWSNGDIHDSDTSPPRSANRDRRPLSNSKELVSEGRQRTVQTSTSVPFAAAPTGAWGF